MSLCDACLLMDAPSLKRSIISVLGDLGITQELQSGGKRMAGGGGAGPTGGLGQQGPQGAQGDQGIQGIQGNPGVDAYTTATGPNGQVQPAVSSAATFNTSSDASFLRVGQIVYIQSGGYYSVNSAGPSGFNATNLGYPGNAAPGTPFVFPVGVSPGGVKGATGATGPAGMNGTTVLTTNFFRATGFAGIVTNNPVATYTIPATGVYYFYGQLQIVNTSMTSPNVYIFQIKRNGGIVSQYAAGASFNLGGNFPVMLTPFLGPVTVSAGDVMTWVPIYTAGTATESDATSQVGAWMIST